jgi:hypothetical protein
VSGIAERARAEADEAEREDEEAAESETSDQEPEVDESEREDLPQPPVTEARFAKIEKQIAGEDTRHEKRLREIYGDLWGEREVCPLCMQEGFIVPPGPEGFDPEHRMVVLSAMGEGAPVTFKQNPKFVPCEHCDALGFLATGSRREGYTDVSCDRCDGKGYVDPALEATMRAITGNGAADYSVSVPPAVAVVNSDTWGRPAGHPHWGQNPADVGIPL